MITLFRRIRQNLIDSGSITKYLIYAVGEILLVVTGILIALQVNNWNEEQQSINELRSSFEYLIEEILANNEQLTALTERRETIIASCNILLEGYLKGELMESSEFLNIYLLVVAENKFEASRNGIDKVLSSNAIELKELLRIRDLIRTYDQKIAALKELEEKENLFIENMETKLASNGFMGSMWNEIRQYYNDSNMLVADRETGISFREVMEYDEVKFLFTRYELVMPFVNGEYQSLIENGEQIIAEINKYQNKL